MKESLTPEENARMLAYRQRRFERALQPVDKPLAEETLRALMKTVGYDTGRIIWCPSPPVAQAVISSLSGYTTKKPTYPSTPETLKLAKEVLAQHGEKLVSHGSEKVYSPWFVGDGFSNGWIAFYSFGSSLIPEEKRVEQEKLKLLETLSDVASWIYSFEGVSIMTERPITSWTSTQIDDRPVLHSTTGPSVKYPDWELFHYRGTQIPRDFIMARDKYSPMDALTWENVEQRQALCELMGWEKVIGALGDKVKVIDEDPNPMFGSLLQVDLPDAPRQKFLRAKCGTGRMITLAVDETAKTALEAGARSYNVSVDLYRQMKTRT